MPHGMKICYRQPDCPHRRSGPYVFIASMQRSFPLQRPLEATRSSVDLHLMPFIDCLFPLPFKRKLQIAPSFKNSHSIRTIHTRHELPKLGGVIVINSDPEHPIHLFIIVRLYELKTSIFSDEGLYRSAILNLLLSLQSRYVLSP